MLKKLVKYGNSNALILDKAILELLNIEEGATIKLKTDGKSIIITPHTKAISEKVSETFTHNQANIEAYVKESLKKHLNINEDVRKTLEKELQNLIKKHQELHAQLTQNSDFFEEVAQIKNKLDASSPEYVEAYKALRTKYSPELVNLEKVIADFESKHKLNEKLSEKQQKAMEKEFRAHFKKYHNIQMIYGELLNNPKYQHEAQLIAEKYNSDKESLDYLTAMDELTDKYNPEIKKSREAIKVISKKYSK